MYRESVEAKKGNYLIDCQLEATCVCDWLSSEFGFHGPGALTGLDLFASKGITASEPHPSAVSSFS